MASSSGSSSTTTMMKMIIVGDSGTGKSCLLQRFTEDTFGADHAQTIGVDFSAKVVTLLGRRVKLQIWDTAGQERYHSVTRSYFRGASAALILYDVSNRESYDHVPYWLADVRRLSGPAATVMLIGSKTDLAEGGRRRVPHTEASVFAQSEGLLHLETSAATGEFVSDAFLKVAKVALQKALGLGGDGQPLQQKLEGHGSADSVDPRAAGGDSAPTTAAGAAGAMKVKLGRSRRAGSPTDGLEEDNEALVADGEARGSHGDDDTRAAAAWGRPSCC